MTTRDASNTRQLLLVAARRRFARDGYAATTVREIANDAGVNVALINRYFTSKEGLFEACIARAAEHLDRSETAALTVEDLLRSILRRLPNSTEEYPLELMLLLRSSGDDRADEIRRTILESFATGMAETAGWHEGIDGGDAMILRAQIALATTLGIVLLRSTTGIEPLASATASELEAPLRDLLSTLLAQARS
jgi:AcrR family transcriptional regulator